MCSPRMVSSHHLPFLNLPMKVMVQRLQEHLRTIFLLPPGSSLMDEKSVL